MYHQICLNLSLIVIFVSIIQWQDSEKRQSRIASLRQRQRNLKDEFSEAKQRLLDENQRWSYGRKFWNVCGMHIVCSFHDFRPEAN